jgi:hypothetical protein
MAKAGDWQDATRKILDALNLREEFAALGVEITGTEPTHTGWLECRAVGRDDGNKTSGGVNVGDGHARGRYRDLGGEGLSLSFFDFAAKFGPYEDWLAARKHYAHKTSTKLPSAHAPKRPTDSLVFKPWNDAIAALWARHKPGITVEGLKAMGCRLARWPAKSAANSVLAMPGYGPDLEDADPTAWVIWNTTGQDLPLFAGKGGPPRPVKMLSTGGSVSSWLGLHALRIMADPDRRQQIEVVWKTEGPTDMLALWAAIPEELRDRHLVLSNSAGSTENPRRELIEMLAGLPVCVIHDTDGPNSETAGELGAEKWANRILPIAGETRNVRFPWVENWHDRKIDVRNWLGAGHTYAELLQLRDATTPWEIPPDSFDPSTPAPAPTPLKLLSEEESADTVHGHDGEPAITVDPSTTARRDLSYERAVCKAIQIDVLGEEQRDGGGGLAIIFSEFHRKMAKVDVAKLSYAELLKHCGPPIKEKVHDGKEVIPDLYTVKEVRDAIATLAGYQRVDEEILVGPGCWYGIAGGVDHHAEEAVILVRSGEAAIWNGSKKLERVKVPRARGRLLDLSKPVAWFEHEKLAGYLQDCESDPKWAEQTVDEAVELFAKWFWKHEKTAPSLVAGLVLCTWVQTLWHWRPLVSITGASDSGKSTLFEVLSGIFGGLAISSSQSSEAGIRQVVRSDAPAILCDEFESDQHRQKILNLFRTASKGSKILRGTSNQKGQSFGLRHIPWVAAVEVGLSREPDRNRFISLELQRPPSERRGKIYIPATFELEDLGQRLLAVAVRYVYEARRLAEKLKGHRVEGVHGRVVESYATPVAMLAVTHGYTEANQEKAFRLLELMLENADTISGLPDEEDLMQAMLSAHVDMGRDGRHSVGQLLEGHVTDWRPGLEKNGIGIVYGRLGRRNDTGHDREYLFIMHGVVCSHLLRGTKWADQSIDQILLRLPGAERSRRRVGGQNGHGVLIPMEYMQEKFLKSLQQQGLLEQQNIEEHY